MAQYADADSFGKWSPDDDLYFVRGSDVAGPVVVPVSAPTAGAGGLSSGVMDALPIVGGLAALGGLALIGGGGGDDDGGSDGGGVLGDSDSADETPDGGGDGDGSSTGGEVDDDLTPEVAFTSGTKGTDHTVRDCR